MKVNPYLHFGNQAMLMLKTIQTKCSKLLKTLFPQYTISNIPLSESATEALMYFTMGIDHCCDSCRESHSKGSIWLSQFMHTHYKLSVG